MENTHAGPRRVARLTREARRRQVDDWENVKVALASGGQLAKNEPGGGWYWGEVKGTS